MLGFSMARPSAADLGKLPLFGGMTEDALRNFAEAAVEVIKHTSDGDITLWKIRTGESFGEMSLIDMQPRSATVVATADSSVWCWGYPVFRERYTADGKCYTL